MSSQNVISICNLALLSIGTRVQISNFNEGSQQADSCALLYDFVYTQLARTAYWNCLRKQATLSLLAAAQGTPENPDGSTLPLPPTPWLYSYQVPSDLLMARYIVPSLPSSGSNPISPAMTPSATWMPLSQWGQIPFEVAYDTDSSGNPIQIILTNQTQAQMVYTVNQSNPQVWDSDFTAAMVASLAAYLVPALTLNMKLMEAQVTIADRIIANARMRDGNEGFTTQDHIPDWITARNSGGGFGSAGYGYNFGYLNMAWPC